MKLVYLFAISICAKCPLDVVTMCSKLPPENCVFVILYVFLLFLLIFCCRCFCCHAWWCCCCLMFFNFLMIWPKNDPLIQSSTFEFQCCWSNYVECKRIVEICHNNNGIQFSTSKQFLDSTKTFEPKRIFILKWNKKMLKINQLECCAVNDFIHFIVSLSHFIFYSRSFAL